MLENVFDRGLDLMERAGLINIFQNLIKSAKFMDISGVIRSMTAGMPGESGAYEAII